MNQINLMFFGERDDSGNIKICADRPFAFADEIRFVRFEAMNAEAIFLRVNRNSAQPEFGRSPEDANGDFTTIGDEQFFTGFDSGDWLGSRWF
jgi:hypothetical protein